jgi:uncharacterized protein
MKPLVLEKDKNYLAYSIDGKSYFYENLFGTIHVLNEESRLLKEKIKSHSLVRKFGADNTTLSRKLKALDTLVINCTESCNLNCGYCIYSGSYASERAHNPFGRMNEKIAFKALDDFLASSIEEPNIAFYGGEPLLEAGLILKVIERAKMSRKKPKFALTTNFTLARKSLQWLAANNMRITVSLDGPKHIHDRHRKHRNGKGSYDAILENLYSVEREFPEYFENNIALSATLSAPETLLELKRFFEGHPLLSRLPLRMQTVERNFLDETSAVAGSFNPESIALAESLFWDIAENYCGKVASGSAVSWFERALFDMPLYQAFTRSAGAVINAFYPRGMCIPGARKLFVDARGDYYMCEKIGKRLPLGSVNSGILLEKVENALNAFCSIRQNLCNDCWAYRDCPSCAVSAKDIDGVSINGLKLNCGALESRVFTGLALYTRIIESNPAALKLYFKDYTAS